MYVICYTALVRIKSHSEVRRMFADTFNTTMFDLLRYYYYYYYCSTPDKYLVLTALFPQILFSAICIRASANTRLQRFQQIIPTIIIMESKKLPALTAACYSLVWHWNQFVSIFVFLLLEIFLHWTSFLGFRRSLDAAPDDPCAHVRIKRIHKQI